MPRIASAPVLATVTPHAAYRNKLSSLTDELEAAEREAHQLQQVLVARANQSQADVFTLKNEVFMHARCQYPPILEYLDGTVRRLHEAQRWEGW